MNCIAVFTGLLNLKPTCQFIQKKNILNKKKVMIFFSFIETIKAFIIIVVSS